MKRSSAISTLALLGCLSVAGQQAQPTIPDPLVVTIDAQKTSDAVSKYVFGSFIEHIGTLIYRSIWAELLDDRKFYFPITSTDAQTPPPQSRNPLRQPLRKWRPVGPEDAVLMDTDQPFVGEHSPGSCSMLRLRMEYARADFRSLAASNTPAAFISGALPAQR